MTIHFIYSIPYPRTGHWSIRFLQRLDRLSRRFSHLPEWYRFGWLPALVNPLPSPGSITKHLVEYLRHRAPTRLYAWDETREINYREDDILLGHPNPDPNTIFQKALRSNRKCKAKVLLFPIHHGIKSMNEFVLPLLDRADLILGIMGPYWFDTLDQSFLAPWMHKMVRLDMAINASQYPHIKKKFNLPGERGYLYIGSNRPEKGPEILNATMARLTNFPKGWIGFGPDFPSIPRLSTYAELTPAFISGLLDKYDIFVNTSISDANPTTILEAMAWGYPVACTPQSGYYNIPSITTLSISDPDKNVEALLKLQYMAEEGILDLSKTNRELIERQYTWQQFCSNVWQSLKPYIQT